MNKGHKLLSLLLCAAVLLTLISPAALAEGETLPENEVVLSQTPAASAAQEGASGEAAEETPAPQATPRPQESQAAGESPETTPAESPKESPTESPKESPAESPKESPVESPKESPTESPKESPAQTPAGEFTISYDYNGGAAGALLMLNAGQNGENAAQNGENAAQGGENAAQNGENAAPAPAAESVTGNSGQKIVLANAPIKPERDFAGWKSTRTGKQYAAGESYEIQGNDTLVAQWNMRSVLQIDVQPEEGSALLAYKKTISAISEDEQALVEQAIKNAQPATGDALTLSAFEPEVLASDVSFIGADGSAQQPAEGETVPMTVTVPAGAMEGEGFWMVYHLTENSEGGYIATPVQFMPADANGASVELAADGFSIYAVAKVYDTEGVAVAKDSTFDMPVEHQQVFYYKDDQYDQYTYHRYTWTIEGNDDIVRGYATPMPMNDLTQDRYQYPWLSVDALSKGTVTVTLNYYYYNAQSWWSTPTGETDSGSIAFIINVTERPGLRIDNNIVVDGTLRPVYVDENGNRTYHDNWTYTWTAQFFHTDNSGGETEIKDEDSSIDPAALYKDGSLNVAIDNGGIREETVNGEEVLHVTTYTVTAKDEKGNPQGEASHRVEFGGNVLNGSFEYPAIPSGTNYAFANGTHQLFWRTTAPGVDNTLGQDVELGNADPYNPYLPAGSTAADGTQYAELNAEAVGTLYQDVLTAPGAELSWGFSHRSRKDMVEVNTMYLIIASSEDGAKIHTQAQINNLIRNYTADGETVTTSNGGRYTLWKMEGDANHWQNHFGSYKVPHGQYATRFFFASASGKTTGNLIDNVTFNQEQRYIIEYYLNGTKVDELTETKTAEVNTAVSPKNLASDKLTNAILADSTINGESYGGVTMTILPRPEVDAEHRDCRNVLRLYFVTGAITVRKVVTIENWDDLTDAERKELGYNEPYIAKFELYEGAPGEGQKVADASISIDLINQSQKTGVAQFMQLDDNNKPYPYKPKANAAYWVKEVDGSTQTPLYAYELTTTYEPSADGSPYGSVTTDEHANGSVTVTNAYALHLFDLTIKTSGVEDIDENQTYIYRVRGNDAHTKLIDLTVAIHGDGQATVKNLPSGEYKVTQVNAWSWRYTPDQTAERSVTLNANGTVVEYKQTRAHEGDAGNKWKWLNGQHWIDNRWKDGSSSGGVPGDEGGDENSIKD